MTKRIGILTSGGDAQGMNAAVRSVVRTGLDRGAEVYAIYEGYQGLVDDGDYIRKMNWDSVGRNLAGGRNSDRLCALRSFPHTGRPPGCRKKFDQSRDRRVDRHWRRWVTDRREYFSPGVAVLISELAESGEINAEEAAAYPNLSIVGLVGSIDNDFSGTDMTIGTDSALHRITEAVDAITSTAASHQRTFVVKVMGRNCGYLALMGALACGADWVLIPEAPPDVENWQDVLVERLKAGRKAGRRDSIVILAEGARDRNGNYIGSSDVQRVLEEKLQEEVRVTVLGHVQRGGRPSAFDRTLSTLMGYEAVNTILAAKPEDEPVVIGIRNNRMTRLPLMESVLKTQAVVEAVNTKDYERAMSLRSSSFKDAFQTFKTMVRALPHPIDPDKKRFRIAVLNAGAPAPGMNTAARAAIRLGLDTGHIMLGVQNGFEGLIEGEVESMNWMNVSGWATRGGSMLGTTRRVPKGRDLYAIARVIEDHHIDALLMIGGWTAYEAAFSMLSNRPNFPSFQHSRSFVCLPRSTIICRDLNSASEPILP